MLCDTRIQSMLLYFETSLRLSFCLHFGDVFFSFQINNNNHNHNSLDTWNYMRNTFFSVHSICNVNGFISFVLNISWWVQKATMLNHFELNFVIVGKYMYGLLLNWDDSKMISVKPSTGSNPFDLLQTAFTYLPCIT